MLIYLNLSKFDTSSVALMNNMFEGCSSLEILNLFYFKINETTNIKGISKDINSKIISCIYDNISRQYMPDNFRYFGCDNNCFNNNYRFLILEKNNVRCVDKCFNDNITKFEYNNNCYKLCPNNTHISYYNDYLCEDDIKCLEFGINNTACKEKTKEGYYFDINDGIYKRCHNNCKTCDNFGNETHNNCIECKEQFQYIYYDYYINKNNNKNCRMNCPYKMFLYQNNYICTNNDSCPENFSKLIDGTNNCTEDIKIATTNIELSTIYYESDKIKTNSIENNTTIYESLTNIIEQEETIIKNDVSKKDEKISSFFNDMVNHNLDNVIGNVTKNKKDVVQIEDDLIMQITTSENQKNNNNSNISTIDLGDCEDKLKEVYEINKTLPLIIFKIDYISPDTLIPIIGYEIYHPLNNSRLDLTYCEDILIKLNIPVSINEDSLFKYDPNSGYYTDNCYAYTTTDGTDIILNDRKQEFSDNNLSLCENNCNYIGYDSKSKRSSCDCAIKNKMELISEIMDNPDKLSNEFSSESSSSSSSIITMKCTKNLFTKEGLKSNISSYILLVFIFFFTLSIMLFIKCGYPLLKNDINEIIKKKRKVKKGNINNNNDIIGIIRKQNKNKKGKFKNRKKNQNNNTKKIVPNSRPVVLNLVKNENKNKNKLFKNNKKGKGKLKLFGNSINSKKHNIRTTNSNNKILKQNSRKSGFNNLNNKQNSQKKDNNNKKINCNIFELNTLDYKSAIDLDKRTCSEYYISLIKTKHPLIFSFCPIIDYNSIIIKFCMFLLFFSVYYAINFAFFSEEIIHDIYEEGGNYNFTYFIPKISIAFAISHVINIIIKYIFLSERNILEVKKQPTSLIANSIIPKVQRSLIIKYTLFFILGLIFLGFFWILLSSFGAVYQNTQMFVFKNTLISFGISLVYPFFINIIPCIFRMSSLNSEDKSSECLYNFSKALQLL